MSKDVVRKYREKNTYDEYELYVNKKFVNAQEMHHIFNIRGMKKIQEDWNFICLTVDNHKKYHGTDPNVKKTLKREDFIAAKYIKGDLSECQLYYLQKKYGLNVDYILELANKVG